LSEKKLNILEHFLVPKHVLLSQEEAEMILTNFKIKPYQMPYIKSSDPAARTINAKPGDIIKIIRESPIAGKATTYRYVIQG
jgi:DNA-directed RNA polymerase subunit H